MSQPRPSNHSLWPLVSIAAVAIFAVLAAHTWKTAFEAGRDFERALQRQHDSR